MAEQVSSSHEEIVVAGPDGEMVKLLPVPKPVGQYKARPVYDIDDAQHLDFPFWREESGR
ncbi:MAG: hypothetical protein ABSE73_04465 [Planctomycetota bacterium]